MRFALRATLYRSSGSHSRLLYRMDRPMCIAVVTLAVGLLLILSTVAIPISITHTAVPLSSFKVG